MRESLSAGHAELSPQTFGIETYYGDLVESYFSALKHQSPQHPDDLAAGLETILSSPDGKQKIQSIQYKLKVEEGYDLGPFRNGGIDGDPGSTTRKVIFQYLQELTLYHDHDSEQYTIIEDTRCELTELLGKFTTEGTYEQIVERADMVNIITNEYIEQQSKSSMQFGYITDHDIRGLVYLETLFANANTNAVGSTGLMQLTVWPSRQMKKTPEEFDMDYIRHKFTEYGYDFDRVHSSKKLRLQAYMDPRINAVMGVAYLHRCENASSPYQSRIAKITDHADTAKEAIEHELTIRDISYKDKQIDAMIAALQYDPHMQQKFMAYARYNGDSQDRHGFGIAFKYIYAATILFLGEQVF